MQKPSRLCAMVVAASVIGGLARAETRADATIAPSIMEQVWTRQLESLLGREVKTRLEGDSGRIIDLLTDRNGKLKAAVVEMGGFLGIGTRKIAIDWRAFSFQARDQQSNVILDVNREQLRLAPEYTAREPVIVPMTKD